MSTLLVDRNRLLVWEHLVERAIPVRAVVRTVVAQLLEESRLHRELLDSVDVGTHLNDKANRFPATFTTTLAVHRTSHVLVIDDGEVLFRGLPVPEAPGELLVVVFSEFIVLPFAGQKRLNLIDRDHSPPPP